VRGHCDGSRTTGSQAVGGDVQAFVDLTRHFQHFAFGSALAQVRDFQQAEDIVQEAFVAAWTGLPMLAEPAAFPGWLRASSGITPFEYCGGNGCM